MQARFKVLGQVWGAVILALACGRAQGQAPEPQVVLGCITQHSVAVNVFTTATRQCYLEYAAQAGGSSGQTSATTVGAGSAANITISGLASDTQFLYTLWHRTPGEAVYSRGVQGGFHTQRPAGSKFTFDIEADPHYLDFTPEVYWAALDNIKADRPDFLIDLGDTFMTEKYKLTAYDTAKPCYLAMRTGFLNRVGQALPLFLVNGNHESELGWLLKTAQPQDNIAVWACQLRHLYFPCPAPGDFFSGATAVDSYQQAPRDGYYAFTWGDALFVVLDPFWYTTPKPNKDGWGWTLGRDQYDWLDRTLTQSTAHFKFVFLHNLVGGGFDGQGRGGVEFAPYFEWGGQNSDGTAGFATRRPGWPMPIQDLLLIHGVNVVFHGHDHLYVKQDLDADGDGKTDLIYQEVPQPSNRGYGATSSAATYGYTHGTIIGNSGHLRVNVSGTSFTVQYVRAYAPADVTAQRVNGQVADAYTVSTGPAPLVAFPGTIVLGRPTNNSMTLNVLSTQTVELYADYGLQTGVYSANTPTTTAAAGLAAEIKLDGLQPDTRYFYRLAYRRPGGAAFQASPEYSFQTQRAPGRPFTFVIEADPHLYDIKGNHPLMERALRNEAADSPDFLIDLGDTFGDDHVTTITFPEMLELHQDMRRYFDIVCRSAPLLFCLGNHEGECGAYLNGTPDNIDVYATLARKRFYSNPFPNGFYTGNGAPEGYGIGLPENYYAWEWGDALFVVLDAYRHMTVSPKPSNLWDWTLGKKQYDWFKSTLEASDAKFKFVFTHHVMGQTRGGAVYAYNYEWGGNNGNGTPGFAANRPGWAKPIHQLMVDNKVTIFFQGHDHLFAREMVDGIVYQEVPMPSDATYNIGSVNAGAYTGDVLTNSGHLRVTVSGTSVKVDYVRAWLPQDETGGHVNGEVAFSYTIQAPRPSAVKTTYWNRY